MRRKLSPLAVAALTGALGFSTTPLWSGSNPEHGQNRDRMTMEQSPENRDQTQIDGKWTGTAGNEMSSQQVREVQEALKQQGHDPGTIDGVLDAETQAAIQSFQQSSGLEATGQLDDQTMAQLGVQEHSSERSSADYERSSAESEGRSGNFGSSVDSEATSTHSAESSLSN